MSSKLLYEAFTKGPSKDEKTKRRENYNLWLTLIIESQEKENNKIISPMLKTTLLDKYDSCYESYIKHEGPSLPYYYTTHMLLLKVGETSEKILDEFPKRGFATMTHYHLNQEQVAELDKIFALICKDMNW